MQCDIKLGDYVTSRKWGCEGIVVTSDFFHGPGKRIFGIYYVHGAPNLVGRTWPMIDKEDWQVKNAI